jgi:hypothetical protein
MIHDLDATLTQLLDDAGAPAELRDADVDFRTPDRNFSVNDATVNLFLHQVKENRELRDPLPVVDRVGPTFVRRQPPLRADCAYLVTAWANANLPAGDRILVEHRLLGQALLWLSRFPTIPPGLLQGSLVGQPFPLPTLVAQLDDNRNAGEFWTALGTPPRPAFYLVVTIAMDLALTVATGPLVTTRLTDFQPGAEVDADKETWVQIGGLVLTPARAGIPDALVDVVDAGLRTLSDADGRYTFPRVPLGSHTLRVVATGFQPKTQPLDVPDLPAGYEVTLTPN